MELVEKEPRDPDTNCRLRHGLNVFCLAHIFQYLNSSDLYKMGKMNGFYNQIINELVIPKHEINFNNLYDRGITNSQIFEKYGLNIKKLVFHDTSNKERTSKQLVQSITKYCSVDQLRSFTINCWFQDYEHINLPIQCRKLEKLEFLSWSEGQLSVQLSENLRYLHLKDIILDPNFNWTELKNLTELYLNNVRGINSQNLIELFHHRPNLEVFHHDSYTFENSTQNICGGKILWKPNSKLFWCNAF